MHRYFVGFAALIVVAQASLGIAAIANHWIPPWARRRVVRPKLWGWGALAGAVGWSLFMFLGPFQGPDADFTPYALGGMGLFIASQVVQMMAQHPGWRPVAPPDTQGQ
ncbi:hypothetical protein ACFWJM_18335 [Streptomyces sp. NPDC127077]|uniref:hypothetical protein n=1 Tax=Streptomyces sp. NPDC127077 TaxID=3347131 RepID=UPI003660AE7B